LRTLFICRTFAPQFENDKAMRTTTAIPTEMKTASKREQSQVRLSSAEREQAGATLKVLMNHIYELHKGVRHMVLFTCNKKYSELAIQRLESQGIPYLLQPAGQQNLNVYFGRRECLEAIRLIVTRPLNQLTPEEDFILGAMLGYDLCAQCERYCKRKGQCEGTCQGKCGECINRN
jgi:hypothetical protein